MAARTQQRQLKLCLTYILTNLFAINVQCQVDGSAQHPIGLNSPRHYPDLPVLGYVTPWNSRGKGLVEEHRQKFDIISPVWYTIHANEAAGEGLYTVRGGPPSKEDEEWYRRLQQPLDSEDSSKPLQITPRFFLDNWRPEDYKGLVLNGTRWKMLSDVIMDVVKDMSFDGVVFESGGSYAMGPPLTALSHALHDEGKILVLVMPPVRDSDDERTMAHNSMVLKPLPGLSHYVDYFSIMTYDMTGPGGRQVYDATGLPEDSSIRKAIAQGQVREPGPNTSVDWVRDNLVAFVEASQANTMEQLQFPSALREASVWASRKFLMGVPQYGYKYPVMFIDRKTGDVAQKPLKHTGAAAPLPVLAGAGEPVTTVEIMDILKGAGAGAKVSKTEEGEFFFDYLSGPEQGHWRVFLPTSESMSQVLDAIQDVVDDELMYSFGGAGVALWDVGQSSGDLLASL
ncbi:hypothetical protein VSDG_05241 [Cytospora chrysosperma]|uniref:Chitinase domain-containing protein 1 n=1 Tax=Cytospora chrysosperma TaxID=252740 RepID=A0A423VY46_CYTCH|nr:hypothetical protein VSDG_05241 [Valsa sordida]